MKNSLKKLTLLVLAGSLLAGCSNGETTSSNSSINASSNPDSNPTSDTSSSSSDGSGEVSFYELASLLSKTIDKEVSTVSSLHSVATQVKNDSQHVVDKTITIYSDSSSSATGTVTVKDDKATLATGSINERKTSRTDKIKVSSSQTSDFNMYYGVTVYGTGLESYSNYYSNSGDRRYIVEEGDDVSDLDSDSYIYSKDYASTCSTGGSYEIASFAYTDLYANSALIGTTLKAKSSTNSDGDKVYSVDVSYSAPGDNLDVTDYTTIKFNAVLNNDSSYIKSASFSSQLKEQNNADPTDFYLTSSAKTFDFTYGTRSDVPSKGLLKVGDYFVESISDVDVTDSSGKVLDASKITFGSVTYLFGTGKGVLPTTAISSDLYNVGSSDSAVVKYTSDGYFEIVGLGKATLSFSYYGCNYAGIYQTYVLKKEVIIVGSSVTDISVGYSSDFYDDTLYTNTTYTLNVSVLPSSVSQLYTFTLNDSSLADVSVNEDNALVIKPLKVGTLEITLASSLDPSITKKLTYTIEENEVDYSSFLLAHSYKYVTLYEAYYILSFTSASEGKIEEYAKSTDTLASTYTFSYTLKNHKITFSNWGASFLHQLTFGLITKGGKRITGDAASNYTDDVYDAIKA
jgi:hypothetical protein